MAQIIKLIILILWILIAPTCWAFQSWVQRLQRDIPKILKNADGNFGIYILSLPTGLKFGLNADRPWYLASATKVAVAIEFYNQLAQGKIQFTDTHQMTKTEFRDGAGPTHFLEPGKTVTLRQLLELMLLDSDNAATDILISKLGLDNINKTIHQIAPTGFFPMTTLLDVRRLAYSQIHPRAMDLENFDFIRLKKLKSDKMKLAWLQKRLGFDEHQMIEKSLRRAFEKYYETHLNSATLKAYAELLTIAAKNQDLMQIMSNSTTGQNRIRKGLPKGYRLAHKTGTQLSRLCDMGIAFKTTPEKGLLILVCAEKFNSIESTEKIFQEISEAISNSGALRAIE